MPALSVGRGGIDAYKNGLGYGNGLQIVGGALGLAGNVATGSRVLGDIASDVGRIRVDSFGSYGGVPVPKRIYLEPVPGTGRYADVGGHHVHSKKAFEGISGYSSSSAFAVSDQMLASYGVRHADITGAQQRLFREFSASGRPNTLTHHSRIAYQSMVRAGLPNDVAKGLVAQSQSQLIKNGIFSPNVIPWGNR
jgi:hypothetical protein